MSLHNVLDITRICYTYEANQGCSVASIYFQIIIHRDLNTFWIRLHSISSNKNVQWFQKLSVIKIVWILTITKLCFVNILLS